MMSLTNFKTKQWHLSKITDNWTIFDIIVLYIIQKVEIWDKIFNKIFTSFHGWWFWRRRRDEMVLEMRERWSQGETFTNIQWERDLGVKFTLIITVWLLEGKGIQSFYWFIPANYKELFSCKYVGMFTRLLSHRSLNKKL